jgi:uncharacterized protein (TIGR00299 family) protein
MTLASLVHAGAELGEVSSALAGLGLEFGLEAGRVEVNGVGALHLAVEYPPEPAHRNLRDIRDMIEAADLPGRAGERATGAFYRLAVAEGRVHDHDPEEVTFHEVGAADSILDLVGSCVALELLEAETVSCGPLPMSAGVVEAAHGPLPVPGPATLEILKGSRVRWVDEPREMTTPTGAALMAELTAGRFTDAAPPMTLGAVGYGAGTARFESAPNLLRAVVGEVEGSLGDLVLLEANVDDASGEILGAAVERLLERGAPDAWLEPVYMKRGRGAYKICALVPAGETERLAREVMRASGTLGVRHYPVGRTVAERRVVEVKLPYGVCRVKVGSLDGEEFVAAPEYADVRRLAREQGIPLNRVYADAAAAGRQK